MEGSLEHKFVHICLWIEDSNNKWSFISYGSHFHKYNFCSDKNWPHKLCKTSMEKWNIMFKTIPLLNVPMRCNDAIKGNVSFNKSQKISDCPWSWLFYYLNFSGIYHFETKILKLQQWQGRCPSSITTELRLLDFWRLNFH